MPLLSSLLSVYKGMSAFCNMRSIFFSFFLRNILHLFNINLLNFFNIYYFVNLESDIIYFLWSGVSGEDKFEK